MQFPDRFLFFFFVFFFLLKTIHNTTKLHTALLLQKRITKITYNTPFYKLGYVIYNTAVNGKGKKKIKKKVRTFFFLFFLVKTSVAY